MYFPFDNIASNLSPFSDILNDDYHYEEQEICCSKCKTKLSDFLDTGFVGCAHCYDEFKDYAISLAQDVHGRATHVGKVPNLNSKFTKSRELERLINEKNLAVKNEQYIKADELKKQIEKLRGEINDR